MLLHILSVVVALAEPKRQAVKLKIAVRGSNEQNIQISYATGTTTMHIKP